jgi:hypothetical protein
MRLSLPLLAGAFCTLIMSAAFANDADFKLVNHTGYQIDEVYAGPHSSKSWGKDIMGNNALDDGETVNISFPHGGSACIYDIYVKYHDGSDAQFDSINLCKFEKVSLFWDGKVTRFAGE